MWRTTSSLIVLGVGLVGCTETGTLRLDGQVAPSGDGLVTGTAQQPLTLGDGMLVVTRARVAVSEIELEGGEEEDEREAEMGAAVIDLDVDGAPTTVAVSDVEAGTYHTLGLEFTTRDLEGARSSVLVEGTYDGAPFAVRSSWTPEAEFPLDPIVDVPADGEATAGIVFDVASWFTASDGTVIDPTADGAEAQIEQRFIDSITAAAEIELEDDGDD